jgi:hypothetical protein
MPYNDTSQEFLNTLTKYNCPKRWIEEAKAYQKNPSIATSEDMERLYNHILTFILDEGRTTSSVKTEAKVFEEPKEEPKYERNWEDEVEGEEDFNVRVHVKVADEYGDMKSEEEE